MASQAWSVVSNKKNSKNANTVNTLKNNVDIKRKVLEEKDINERGDRNKVRQTPKKQDKHVKPDKKSIEEAINDLDIGKLEETLKSMIEKFPDNKLIWMKELSAQFNHSLEMVPMPKSSQLIENEFDHSISLLTKRTIKVLMKIIYSSNYSFNESFFIYCLDNITGNNAEVCSCYGYYIISKLILEFEPSIALNQITSTYSKISKKSYQVNPSLILIIFDIFGHAGKINFGIGVKVWNSLMLPQLTKRHLSSYAFTYIVKLMDYQNDSSHEVLVTMKDFFPIYDIVFSDKSDTKLSLTSHESLKELYPRLRDVCFPDTHSLMYFASFFIRLHTVNHNYMTETFNSIIKIMKKSPNECFDKWYSLSEKNPNSTISLLNMILSNWSKTKESIFKSKTSRKVLLEFLNKLKLSNKFNKSNEDTCTAIDFKINKLIEKVNETSNKWKYLFVFIITCLGAAIYYDIKDYGFKNSKSNEVLIKSGVLPYVEIFREKTYFYTEEYIRWSKENIPRYFEMVKTQSIPYYNLAVRYSIALYEISKVNLLKSYEISCVYCKEVYTNVILYIGDADKKWPFVLEAFNNGKEFCIENLIKLKTYINNDLKITLLTYYNFLQNAAIYYYDLMLPYLSEKYLQIRELIDSIIK